jgi:inorganic pyrophosphatase
MPDPFWYKLDELLASGRVVIDRPAGSRHPRYPEMVYPHDYGYLEGTSAIDGNEIDLWVGSLPDRRLVGVVCTVDTLKRDAEIKLLLGCTPAEMQTILAFHNKGWQGAMLSTRENLA